MRTGRTVIRVATAAAICCIIVVDGFAPTPVTRIIGSTRTIQDLPAITTCKRSTNDDRGSGGSADDEARTLREKANQFRNEAEKMRLALGMKKIDALENDIRSFVSKGDSNASGELKLQELQNRVEELVRGTVGNEEADAMLLGLSYFSSRTKISSSSSGGSIAPNKGGRASFDPPTDEEVTAAIEFLRTLPTPLKNALAMVAGYKQGYYGEDGAFFNMEEFVKKLYHQSDIESTTSKLRSLYKLQQIKAQKEDVSDGKSSKSKKDDKNEEYEVRGMSRLLALKIEERIENTTRAMELFPRSLLDADESILPTKEDANVAFQLLEKNFMATEKPMKVKGGHIIRGMNKRKSATELLNVMDGKLLKSNPQWMEKYQICFVEIYSDANEELFEDAILITPKTFVPIAPAVLSVASSTIAIFFSFVFCIDAFSGNTFVMEQLKEASDVTSAGGTYDLLWFNQQLVPLLLTLGAAQGLHEMSHLVAASLKQVNLTAPTILPSMGLPYLSFQNRIKNSPKGYDDLFDIAFVGPIAGLTVSFLALLVGLQLTTLVDSTTAQLLPSLPVGYLMQSTLAGTIVDLILGGGDGLLLNQDAATQVPLHPIAIGGFLGLIIHALDIIPVGSTDGGRMSQAILGRVWHLTFSSLVFGVLLISSFTLDSTILVGYLFIYSFTQRDMEIPCRNEVDKVELPRAVAALVTWLLAALILVPMR